MGKAVYPGSFDPLSNGHLDIIKRASKVFGELYVLISNNVAKKYLFSVEERMDMAKRVLKNLKNVHVVTYDGLVVNYCKENGINTLIRGLRNYQDYEAEFSLFQFNKDICKDVETVLMFPTNKHMCISSSAIKELVSYNADISHYVPKEIIEEVITKYQNRNPK